MNLRELSLRPGRVGRIAVTARGIRDGYAGGQALIASAAARRRWFADVLTYRLLSLVDIPGIRPRTLVTRDGATLTYRLDRGDIRVVIETWMTQAYRLRLSRNDGVLVDLGTNIGLTSVWLARAYGFERVVGVEPLPANARLARRNLAQNQIVAEVFDAAVGAEDGTATFAATGDSTTGMLGQTGSAVRVMSMESVLGAIGEDERVGLLKLDIEGGERDLLAGAPAWLGRVDCIVCELHPDHVDDAALIDELANAGFAFQRLYEDDPYGPRDSAYMGIFARDGAMDGVQDTAAE